MDAIGVVREARTVREDELLELTHAVYKELEGRGEHLPRGWSEEAVADLRAGRLSGWTLGAGTEEAALAFFSRRGGRAFGHVHALPSPGATERATALLRRLGDDPSVAGLALTAGVTGLDAGGDAAVARGWEDPPRRTAVGREGLERRVDDPGLYAVEPTPAGFEIVPAESVRAEALADLDWRGFRESLDARLFAQDPAENARMIDDLLGGGLGRLLPLASMGLLDGGTRLAGILLTVELSPRVALFGDLVVDPAYRRRGLGRFLLRSGLRALRALGHERARLWVTEGNVAARSLYEGLGFVPYARATVYLQDAFSPQRQDAR